MTSTTAAATARWIKKSHYTNSMEKNTVNHNRPILLPIILSMVGISLLVLNSCSTSLEQMDSFQKSFNDHAEGWLNLIGLLTLLSGWLVTGVSWISKHFEFMSKNGDDVKNKRPVWSFFSINGKYLFRQFPWSKALETADAIAEELLDVNSNTCYDPTMIVGIGRGGAIYGSLISYRLGELPILALDRTYNHLDDGRETKTMYPFRIPKAYLKRVLLVAGESHTKKTLKIFTKKLEELGAGEIRNCVFYKQILQESPEAADVKIHYFGVCRKKDYLLPWQTDQSLHPSENKEDAEAQNSKIGRYVTESENHFDPEESGFYCMRHAETEANEKDVFIGSGTDISLTEKGKQQARKVGNYFKSIGVTFDVIYYSPMVRCFETAREISSIAGGQMIPDERIKELDYGAWEGISRTEIESKYAEDYQRYCSDMSCAPTGSSENANDVSERVSQFIQELKNSNATVGKNVLVVTHKTAGRILLQVAGHNPGGHFRDIPFNNAAIGYVSIKPDRTSVILDNKQC